MSKNFNTGMLNGLNLSLEIKTELRSDKTKCSPTVGYNIIFGLKHQHLS